MTPDEDYIAIAKSRLRRFILPTASDTGEMGLIVEACKIEAQIAIGEQLKRIADCLEKELAAKRGN